MLRNFRFFSQSEGAWERKQRIGASGDLWKNNHEIVLRQPTHFKNFSFHWIGNIKKLKIWFGYHNSTTSACFLRVVTAITQIENLQLHMQMLIREIFHYTHYSQVDIESWLLSSCCLQLYVSTPNGIDLRRRGIVKFISHSSIYIIWGRLERQIKELNQEDYFFTFD